VIVIGGPPKTGKTLHLRLLGWVVFAAVIALWHVVAVRTGQRFMAPASSIGASAWQLVTGNQLFTDVLPSLARAGIGYGVGVVAGVVLGILIGYYRRIDPWVRPEIEFLRSLPKPAILPLALLALGTGSAMKVAVIAFGCFEPALLNAIDGARRIDPLYVETARTMQCSNRRLLGRVVLPAALPQIFAGLRVALAMALIMMVLSEMIASTGGLGYLILSSQRTFRVAEMYSAVFLLGIVGWLFNVGFLAVERRVLAWHTGRQGE